MISEDILKQICDILKDQPPETVLLFLTGLEILASQRLSKALNGLPGSWTKKSVIRIR